ncbi:MAG TPA: cytochrome c-type biogenesis protein CcmH [Rhodocyclaceae bacterium]|nr:cytochrome c-type biogenesis protein CcmH [Rhodocyclaceae bacterium]
MAADPVAEKRLIALTEQLRCLVCQNQSIADSHAELAMDLKREVRAMIAAGKSDKEIIDFMVARYGDFVLYNPPLKTTTVLLWLGPLLLMLVAAITLIRYLRRRNQLVSEDAPLTPEEQGKAAALLNQDPAQ